MKLQSLTIRARLLWLTLGIIIPLVLAGLFNLFGFWQASRAQMEESLVQQARLAAWAFEQRLAAHRGTMEMAAHKNPHSPLLREYLDSIVETRRNWLDVRTVTGSGDVVSQSTRRSELPPVSIEALHLARRHENSLIVLTENSADARIRLLTLALPTDGGGYVVARIDGKSVNDIFENLQIPDENVITILDTNNRLLFRSSMPADRLGLDVSQSPPILNARSRGEGTSEFRSEYDGVQRVYGFTRLESIDGIVSVGVPSAKFYAPLNGQIIRQLLVGLPLTALAILAAYLLARSIARPLRSLSRAARELGSGDRTVRSANTGRGSIGELEASFNRMADEIASREERLASLDRLKSGFVSSVSHELRTPLTTIKALAKVLQQNRVTAEERAEIHETIASECDRQIDFIQNMLDLSRIESGAYKISLRPTDVVETLWETIDVNQRAAISRKLHLRFNPPPNELPLALTDAGAIRRVVSNLLGNALKYTPPGGEILLSVNEKHDQIQVEVSDDGCGIRADDLPLIFDKFYQGRELSANGCVDSSGHLADEGTADAANTGVGLGLYLVQSLVAQMNAEITVESPVGTSGRGTKFTIKLRVAE